VGGRKERRMVWGGVLEGISELEGGSNHNDVQCSATATDSRQRMCSRVPAPLGGGAEVRDEQISA
jgi:hypothetical protein